MNGDGNNVAALDYLMQQLFSQALGGPLGREVLGLDKLQQRRMYIGWLIQAAHLTQYTSSHQALVATRVCATDLEYARYCLNHALEELGHERMALADLQSLGLDAAGLSLLPPPLPSTAALTAYLYFAAERAHPATRLGFTFWAERCYGILAPIFGTARGNLGLDRSQMRFFVAHAVIDEAHGRDVVEIIPHVCTDSAAWAATEAGLRTSLTLAMAMFGELAAVAKGTHGLTPDYDRFFAPAMAR